MIQNPDIMKVCRIFLSTTLLTLAPVLSHGQTGPFSKEATTSESAGPKRFWEATFPGGNYLVALDRISAISKHRYVADENTSLTEVVIAAGGKAMARFYCLEPVAGSDGHGRSGERPTSKRTGLTSTMVDCRVADLTILEKLHESVRGAWISNKGKRFTISTGD